jgi:drug/metabolite transporter (DMT)-like permease
LGVGLLVASRSSGDGPGIDLIAAVALILASVAWAWGSIKAGQKRSGEPVRTSAIQLITGALILLPISAARGEFKPVLEGAVSLESIGALAYLVVFGSLIGFTAYVWLLQRVPAAKVSSHSYVNPLIAVLVGAWLGGERLDLATIAAAGLIVFSVVMIVTSKNAPQTVQQEARRPARRGFRRLVADLALRMFA